MSKEKFGEQYIEFLLGTLEKEPRQELEEHVTQCPECRQNLYELRETLHSLPQGLPENPPPAHLKKRIMEDIVSAMAKEKTKSFPALSWRAWAIAASIAAVVLGGFVIRLHREGQLKDLTIATLQRETEQLRSTNQGMNRKINELTQPALRYLNLTGLTGYEDASGSAFVNPEADRASLFLRNLPSIEEDKDFQLWVIERDQAPYPSNVFQTAGATTELEVELPIGAERVMALAVTIEPRDGSPQPTGPMIVLGTF